MSGYAERIILDTAYMPDEVIDALLAAGQSVRDEPLMAQQEQPGLPLAKTVGYHHLHLTHNMYCFIIQNKCSDIKYKTPLDACKHQGVFLLRIINDLSGTSGCPHADLSSQP